MTGFHENSAAMGGSRVSGRMVGQQRSRKESRTRVPNCRAATGTRSSTPWNIPEKSRSAGSRSGAKPKHRIPSRLNDFHLDDGALLEHVADRCTREAVEGLGLDAGELAQPARNYPARRPCT